MGNELEALQILAFEGLHDCLLIHKELCIVNCITVEVISTLTMQDVTDRLALPLFLEEGTVCTSHLYL